MLRAATVTALPLFAGLSKDECASIEARMVRREYAPQSIIVREGAQADAAFLVISGLVAVRRKDADSGVEFVLAELGVGQMFGEMALLTSKPRAATVVALEPTICAVLNRQNFDDVMRQYPDVAISFARVLAERLDRANQQAGIDFISLARIKVDPRVLTLLPTPLVNEHKVVPIAF